MAKILVGIELRGALAPKRWEVQRRFVDSISKDFVIRDTVVGEPGRYLHLSFVLYARECGTAEEERRRVAILLDRL
jgi:hypothetical protein